MPKNKRGGKGHKKRTNQDNEHKRELIFKEDGQEYAQAVRMLGNGRLEALCFDGKTRLAIIRGKMRKKIWIHAGDIILVGLRDFQDDKCDIIYKYDESQVLQLKSKKHIPDFIKLEDENDFLTNQCLLILQLICLMNKKKTKKMKKQIIGGIQIRNRFLLGKMVDLKIQ